MCRPPVNATLSREKTVCGGVLISERLSFIPSLAPSLHCSTVFVHTGDSSDPGLCGRAEQQWVAVPGPERHGAGTDGDAGHVEQGLLLEAAASLHLRRHQEVHREGI